jgi:hypothetical protein
VPPWELEPPAAPDWLLQQVAPPHRPRMPTGPVAMSEGKARWRVVRAVNRVLEARPGERNATLNRQAFSLGRLAGTGCIDVNSSLVALYQAARYAGLDDGECRTTIRSGFAAGLKLTLQT